MASAANAPISPEEYLERERKAEFRNEYFQGQIVAMGGASRQHGRIVTNLVRELGQRLRRRDCNVYSSDLRVAVTRAGVYAYPDVVVTCGEEKFLDATFDTLLNPAAIIEVSSESTQHYDRGRNESYRSLPSLMEYITVAQDRIHVEQSTRQGDGRWLLTESSDPAGRIQLESLGVDLVLSELYEKVDFAGR